MFFYRGSGTMFIGSRGEKCRKSGFLDFHLADYVAENGLGTFLENWDPIPPLWDGSLFQARPNFILGLAWNREPSHKGRIGRDQGN